MVSETVFGALIGGVGGSLLGGVFSWYSTKQQLESAEERLEEQIRAQDQRRRAEFYLRHKVEALTSLHAALHACKHVYLKQRDQSTAGVTEDDLEELHEAFDQFEEGMDAASAYLTDEQQDRVTGFYNQLYEANTFFVKMSERGEATSLGIVEPPDDAEGYWDRQEFLEQYDEVRAVLQDEINQPIEQFRTN